MSVKRILDLFGSEFNNRRAFVQKMDKILFKNHKRELDSALQSSELLDVLLDSKFGVNQHTQLINLSYVVRKYKYGHENKNGCKLLSIYNVFEDYVHDYINILGYYPASPFEIRADVIYDAIHLLKTLVKEKTLEKYKQDKRVKALSQKMSVRGSALYELGYGSWKEEGWIELYLDESINQPKSVLYILDLNPIYECEYAPETIEPLVRTPDRRFQAFIEHYKDTLSNDQLLFNILKGSWNIKKYNRLFRLSGIVNRVLVAQQYCNKTYVEKVHPLYEFLQEYMFNICASIDMTDWLVRYTNCKPIGLELCHLFQQLIKENKQHRYKTDHRYKEFVKKYKPYIRKMLGA